MAASDHESASMTVQQLCQDAEQAAALGELSTEEMFANAERASRTSSWHKSALESIESADVEAPFVLLKEMLSRMIAGDRATRAGPHHAVLVQCLLIVITTLLAPHVPHQLRAAALAALGFFVIPQAAADDLEELPAPELLQLICEDELQAEAEQQCLGCSARMLMALLSKDVSAQHPNTAAAAAAAAASKVVGHLAQLDPGSHDMGDAFGIPRLAVRSVVTMADLVRARLAPSSGRLSPAALHSVAQVAAATLQLAAWLAEVALQAEDGEWADEAAAGSNACLATLLSDSEGSPRGAAEGDRLALLLPSAVAPGDLARHIVRLQAAAAHLLPGLEQLPNRLQMLLLDLLPLYSSAQGADCEVGQLLGVLSPADVIQSACTLAESRGDPVAFEVAAQLLVCYGNIGCQLFSLTTRWLAALHGAQPAATHLADQTALVVALCHWSTRWLQRTGAGQLAEPTQATVVDALSLASHCLRSLLVEVLDRCHLSAAALDPPQVLQLCVECGLVVIAGLWLSGADDILSSHAHHSTRAVTGTSEVAFALLRVANYSSTLTDDLSEATLVGMGVAAISVAEHMAATGLAAAAPGSSGAAVDGMCAGPSACGAAALGHLAQSQAPAARAACATLLASHGAMQALVQLLATLPPSTPPHRAGPLALAVAMAILDFLREHPEAAAYVRAGGPLGWPAAQRRSFALPPADLAMARPVLHQIQDALLETDRIPDKTHGTKHKQPVPVLPSDGQLAVQKLPFSDATAESPALAPTSAALPSSAAQVEVSIKAAEVPSQLQSKPKQRTPRLCGCFSSS